MKRALLIIFVLNCAVIATAQQQHLCRSVRAHVPFAFQMNGTTMPAGDYQFCWNFNRTVIITNLAAEMPTAFNMITSFEQTTQQKPMLVFRHVGDKYFLAEIEHPGLAIAVLAVSAEEQRYKHIAVKKVSVPANEGK